MHRNFERDFPSVSWKKRRRRRKKKAGDVREDVCLKDVWSVKSSIEGRKNKPEMENTGGMIYRYTALRCVWCEFKQYCIGNLNAIRMIFSHCFLLDLKLTHLNYTRLLPEVSITHRQKKRKIPKSSILIYNWKKKKPLLKLSCGTSPMSPRQSDSKRFQTFFSFLFFLNPSVELLLEVVPQVYRAGGGPGRFWRDCCIAHRPSETRSSYLKKGGRGGSALASLTPRLGRSAQTVAESIMCSNSLNAIIIASGEKLFLREVRKVPAYH